MLDYLLKAVIRRYFNYNWNITIDDPYYDRIPINNKKTKFKKIPKQLPDNLSPSDETILLRFKNKAYRYDMLLTLIGVPFGTANLIQLIPVVGAFLTTYQSLKLIWSTRNLSTGVPPDLIVFFIMNIIIDLLLGLIPIVGDLITISFKSNLRNYALLKNYLFRVSEYNRGTLQLEELRPNWFNNRFNWLDKQYLNKQQ